MRTTGDQSRRIIFTIIPGETWDNLTFFCLDDFGYVKIMGDYYCTDPYIRKHQKRWFIDAKGGKARK